ncbi:putative O-glycosylation ligase, exosortase A system-associated [Glaciecola sp. MF2-115]|uniref:putative O-glycosylation ligase, exosortase A system-associated n=1 Tax=Glaciecola sp. MF2-115 TaxID=3384827 RepID=UPI0039A0E9D8
MRDLVLLGLFPFLIYFAIRKPFIGLSLWLWTSLVPMQTWAYGMATSIRWNLVFALCTIIGYIFMKNKPKVKVNGIVVGVMLLLILATLSSMFHQGYDILVWASWERFFKATIFFIFVFLIVDKKLHIEALMWACVLSVTATAAKQGFKVFFSGGGHVVYGMSSTFSDNNLSAFATLICIPLTLFLVLNYKDNFKLKWGLLGAVGVSVIFILGSDSRGGLLGLIVLAAYYFVKSKRKLPLAFGFFIVGAVGLSLMDASWFERMDSIAEAGEDDSFMGRVIAWKFSILMAMKSPLFGGGFDSIAYLPTWSGLMSNWHIVSFIETPYPSKGHVAHSIYFQVLGDLGFAGFMLFFGLVWAIFRVFLKNEKDMNNDLWLREMCMIMKLSIVVFLVAGAALSVAYNEVIFFILGVAASLYRLRAK